MRVRHRTPSIFSISMVDVLCCALGCMILMWLTNTQELEKETADLSKEREVVQGLRLALDASDQEKERLAKLLSEVDIDKKTAVTKISDLEKQLTNLRQLQQQAERALQQRIKELANLEKRLGALTTNNKTLTDELKVRSNEKVDLAKRATALETRVDDLLKQLKSAEMLVRSLEKLKEEVPGLQLELEKARDRLTQEEQSTLTLKADLAKRLREFGELSKQLEAMEKAKRRLEANLSDKDKDLLNALAYKERLEESERLRRQMELDLARMQNRVSQAQAAVETRFAGVTLSGKRVALVIDTSGSMDLLDEKTPAPTKWAEVQQTVVRVMRSLPDLEKFQVIVFGEEISFLLGSPGEWLDYDAKTSPDQVLAGLARIKPTGGTNMFKALEATFKLRDKGLDTIYLFSDGLPNEGEGLTPEQERTVTDQNIKSNLLGQYIRRKLELDWNRTLSNRERVRINAIGFFFESPNLGAFLWALTRENSGNFVGMSRP